MGNNIIRRNKMKQDKLATITNLFEGKQTP